MDTIILALVAGTGIVFTILKIFPTRKALHYDYLFDIFFTIILPIFLSGSYSGMVLAIITGIVISVELFILKLMIGTEPIFTRKECNTE